MDDFILTFFYNIKRVLAISVFVESVKFEGLHVNMALLVYEFMENTKYCGRNHSRSSLTMA